MLIVLFSRQLYSFVFFSFISWHDSLCGSKDQGQTKRDPAWWHQMSFKIKFIKIKNANRTCVSIYTTLINKDDIKVKVVWIMSLVSTISSYKIDFSLSYIEALFKYTHTSCCVKLLFSKELKTRYTCDNLVIKWIFGH